MSVLSTVGGAVLARVRRLVDVVLRHRDRMPRFVNRVIDHIAESPDGFLGRLAARSLGSVTSSDIPPPTTAPYATARVYIGPTNYAGQGWAWARALDACEVDVRARNMAVDVPGGFSFPADTVVPVPVYTSSEEWQRAEVAAVLGYTHVLFEAERPLFGRLHSRDVEIEARLLSESGISTAFMCHGTDVRLPSRHAALTPWSPFDAVDATTQKIERDAAKNGALLARSGRPVFVSTPDLLLDVPSAIWCPVVVDLERWGPDSVVRERRRAGGAAPRVAHVPSKAAIKGTPLIEPVLERLVAEGRVTFERVSGVPAEQMPAVYATADIVLDQFRLGSYGVAACEAMASGCVVVGHVAPFVRGAVREATGWDLPIVEATPETLEAVLGRLADDPAERERLGDLGRQFVDEVHSGPRSARILLDSWVLA